MFCAINLRKATIQVVAIILVSLAHYQVALAGSPPTPVCGFTSKSFFSNSSPLPITTSDVGVVQSTIVVSGVPTALWDLDLTTFILSPSSGDLDVVITSPAGTSVSLTTDNGGGNDDIFMGTLWDDQASPGGAVPYVAGSSIGIVSDAVQLNGVTIPSLTPEEPLAAFNGEDPNGVWTLSIVDDTAPGQGMLVTWGMDLVSMKASAPETLLTVLNDVDVPISSGLPDTYSSSITVSDPGQIVVCRVEVNTKLLHTFAADIDMTLQSPSGRVVTLTTDNGGGSDNVFADTTWKDRVNTGGVLPYDFQSGSATDNSYSNSVNNPQLSPEEPLGAFDGEVANGVWTLTIRDDASSDGGVLQSWELRVFRCHDEPDTDSDLMPDSCDNCPVDTNKIAAGQCGCGIADTDTDADGTANCNDACPADAAKVAVGICGCGVADTDTDLDGVPNCNDQCPSDAAKLVPGSCGCGAVDADLNSNGIADCLTAAELKERTSLAVSQMKKVKFVNGKLTKKGIVAKKGVSSLLTEISNLVAGPGAASISVNGTQSLAALNKLVKAKIKKALKTGKAADKVAAIKALSKFNSSIVA